MNSNKEDVRWHQRLDSYKHALAQLQACVDLHNERLLSAIEEQGLIKAFEFTYEVAWNLMRDYAFYQGAANITGSRDAFRDAFTRGLVEDGFVWMDMIKGRNLSSHTYDKVIADQVASDILERYSPAFNALAIKMSELHERDIRGE